MPKFKIIVHCRGLNIPDDNEEYIIGGFYTTRYGSGSNEQEAFEKVIKGITKEKEYQILEKITKSREGAEITFEIEESVIVPFHAGLFGQLKGYTFYPIE
jgi:hypothetical protein